MVVQLQCCLSNIIQKGSHSRQEIVLWKKSNQKNPKLKPNCNAYRIHDRSISIWSICINFYMVISVHSCSFFFSILWWWKRVCEFVRFRELARSEYFSFGKCVCVRSMNSNYWNSPIRFLPSFHFVTFRFSLVFISLSVSRFFDISKCEWVQKTRKSVLFPLVFNAVLNAHICKKAAFWATWF